MARRKSLWDEYFNTLDEAVSYIKRIKDINGNSIEVEMFEFSLGKDTYWHVHTWRLK